MPRFSFFSAKSKSKSKEGATSGWFAKFPKDVILSEKLTGGDENLLDKVSLVIVSLAAI
jgi:hypothetical protein